MNEAENPLDTLTPHLAKSTVGQIDGACLATVWIGIAVGIGVVVTNRAEKDNLAGKRSCQL